MIKIPEGFIDRAQQREKQHYNDPIFSREAILDLFRLHGKKARLDDFAEIYEADDRQKALEYRLKAMVRDGQLIDYDGFLTTVDYWPLFKGSVVLHDRQVCAVLDDREGSYTILKAAPGVLFSGDYAVFALIEPLGSVAFFQMIEPSTVYLHGQIENSREYDLPYGYSLAVRVLDGIFCDQVISVKPLPKKTYPIGLRVCIRLDRQAQSEYILGDLVDFQETPKGILNVIMELNLPWIWSQAVMKEAQLLSKTEIVLTADRTDLTMLPFVTIDGVSSKDFDDAVYVQPGAEPGSWQLFVAIADVSHYVRPGTAIDHEAIARGVSVYFPRYVIPMLPEVLSNELCSLKPEELRYALTCRIDLDAQGRKQGFEFLGSVIRSHARLTYDQVQRRDVPITLKKTVADLWTVYDLLKQDRQRRGYISFSQQSIHFDLLDNEHVLGMTREVGMESHHLIEEMMLAANECAAAFLKENAAFGVYRVHGEPLETKVQLFNMLLKHIDKKIEPPYTLSKIADLSEYLKEHHPRLAPMVSRIMQRAGYQIEPDRHFGLNFDLYTHFTSPIRRYPDLLVHRLIYAVLQNKREKSTANEGVQKIPSILSRVNYLERRAEEAERAYQQYLKVQFAQGLQGKVFTAFITGLSEFGVFVELDQYPLDGMVHFSQLGEGFWVYHPAEGYVSNGAKMLRVGTVLNVQLTDTDTSNQRINFSYVSDRA
ncbi:MAG: VacB/RNase II family 3'-5' exoribonuclease [Gammaproteobacteria bacterium]|nr:VacB/RNase II family 3'-5' exoribonuclease [Gammaproteobacteria bacterium]